MKTVQQQCAADSMQDIGSVMSSAQLRKVSFDYDNLHAYKKFAVEMRHIQRERAIQKCKHTKCAFRMTKTKWNVTARFGFHFILFLSLRTHLIRYIKTTEACKIKVLKISLCTAVIFWTTWEIFYSLVDRSLWQLPQITWNAFLSSVFVTRDSRMLRAF